VLATTGVIFTASYMLWMIQRVFYGDLNDNTADVPAPDLDAREHLALWPMVALMLLMGVASPVWMRAIDTATIGIASRSSFLRMPNGAIVFNGHPIPPCDANHPCYVDFRIVHAKEVR
jgi:NADH:ubiquinone oxidoreductase subunit 4 (subunit M)